MPERKRLKDEQPALTHGFRDFRLFYLSSIALGYDEWERHGWSVWQSQNVFGMAKEHRSGTKVFRYMLPMVCFFLLSCKVSTVVQCVILWIMLFTKLEYSWSSNFPKTQPLNTAAQE